MTDVLPASVSRGLERAVARVLTVGTAISIALVALGVAELLVTGASPTGPDWPRLDPGAIPADLAAFRPAGALWLGILGLLATPSARVLAALVGFARGGERVMAIVAMLVLIVVGLGVLAGLSVG